MSTNDLLEENITQNGNELISEGVENSKRSNV